MDTFGTVWMMLGSKTDMENDLHTQKGDRLEEEVAQKKDRLDHSLVNDDDGVYSVFGCDDVDYAIYDEDDRDEEVDHKKVWT